jgi:hypothetical protein
MAEHVYSTVRLFKLSDSSCMWSRNFVRQCKISVKMGETAASEMLLVFDGQLVYLITEIFSRICRCKSVSFLRSQNLFNVHLHWRTGFSIGKQYSLNYPFSHSPICLISDSLIHPPTQTSVHPLNSYSLNHPSTRQYKHQLTQVLHSVWAVMVNVIILPPRKIYSILHRGIWRLKLGLLFFPTDLIKSWKILNSQ